MDKSLDIRWCGYCRVWFIVLRSLAKEVVIHNHDRRLMASRGRMFTESEEYFNLIELDAYNRGKLKL